MPAPTAAAHATRIHIHRSSHGNRFIHRRCTVFPLSDVVRDFTIENWSFRGYLMGPLWNSYTLKYRTTSSTILDKIIDISVFRIDNWIFKLKVMNLHIFLVYGLRYIKLRFVSFTILLLTKAINYTDLIDGNKNIWRIKSFFLSFRAADHKI